MQSTEKPRSKTKSKFFNRSSINKNKSSESHDTDNKLNTSILKKNEFTLIFLGALFLSILIFFFFFRSPEPESEPELKPEIGEQNVFNTSFSDFEIRILNLEKALQMEQDSKAEIVSIIKESSMEVDQIKDRVGRLETVFSIKLDSLIDRMGKIEKTVSQLKNKTTSKIFKKELVPEIAVPVKKAVKKKSIFHVVKKKETLYSISKKYNTTIAKLRELNKLSKGATIYPGDNLQVK